MLPSSTKAFESNGGYWGTQAESAADETEGNSKVSVTTVTTAAPVGWGGGLTLAQRLKKKAEEVILLTEAQILW